MSYFQGKKVLITGGAGGIGFLMSEIILAKGGTVIVWDVNRSAMKEAESKLVRYKNSIDFIYCNLADKTSIKKAADDTLSRYGNIDILINNAGVVTGKPFSECTEEDFELTFNVNTYAHFLTVKYFLPEMIKNNFGHIVTISSAAGLIGVTALADYSASKFAVVGFDESLRAEFKKKHYNINTTLVCPFYINTGMFNGVKTRFPLLLPILDPEKTAGKIIRAIEKKKERLYMPPMVYTTHLLRIFPVKVFDFVAGFFGIQDSMNEFKGRSKNE